MRIPDNILDCTVFVCLPSSEADKPELIATAFLLGTPLEDTDGKGISYVVTAAHIAKKIRGRRFGLRFNSLNGTILHWFGEDAIWWFHPEKEDATDAAVILLPQLPNGAILSVLPFTMLADEDLIRERGIGIGDEVFINGLFVPMKNEVNEPIVRIGNIAFMPKHPVPAIKIAGKMVDADVYLIECRSLTGLSGSPVFCRETIPVTVYRGDGPRKGEPVTGGMAGPFHLLGMMHGHWAIEPSEFDRVDFKTTTKRLGTYPTGISVVVPAKEIREILDCPELLRMRRALRNANWKEHGVG